MKRLLVLLLAAIPAMAAEYEIEGEVWYDANGQVAFVEGPQAGRAPERFVPAWERRERERAHRSHEFRTDRFRFDRFRHRRWYGWPGWSVYRPVCAPAYRPWHPCPTPFRGSSVIIIR